MIILHGGGDGARSWEHNAKGLAEYYSVFIPDLPGFGKSQSMGEKFNINDFVRFVDEFSDSLGITRFNLAGHSIGGDVALRFALRHTHKVKSLVLINSWGLGKDIALWLRVMSHPFLCDTLGEFCIAVTHGIKRLSRALLGLSLPVNFYNRLQIDIGRSMVNLKGQSDVMLQRLSDLLMPTLLICGGKDPVVPAYQSYAAAQIISDCKLHVFQDCGHSVYKQRPDDFNRILHNFFDDLY